MNSKQRERAEEVARIRRHIPECLAAIEAMVAHAPDDMHLGSLRALDNTVSRAMVDVRDSLRREHDRQADRAEREAGLHADRD